MEHYPEAEMNYDDPSKPTKAEADRDAWLDQVHADAVHFVARKYGVSEAEAKEQFSIQIDAEETLLHQWYDEG